MDTVLYLELSLAAFLGWAVSVGFHTATTTFLFDFLPTSIWVHGTLWCMYLYYVLGCMKTVGMSQRSFNTQEDVQYCFMIFTMNMALLAYQVTTRDPEDPFLPLAVLVLGYGRMYEPIMFNQRRYTPTGQPLLDFFTYLTILQLYGVGDYVVCACVIGLHLVMGLITTSCNLGHFLYLYQPDKLHELRNSTYLLTLRNMVIFMMLVVPPLLAVTYSTWLSVLGMVFHGLVYVFHIGLDMVRSG